MTDTVTPAQIEAAAKALYDRQPRSMWRTTSWDDLPISDQRVHRANAAEAFRAAGFVMREAA